VQDQLKRTDLCLYALLIPCISFGASINFSIFNFSYDYKYKYKRVSDDYSVAKQDGQLRIKNNRFELDLYLEHYSI